MSNLRLKRKIQDSPFLTNCQRCLRSDSKFFKRFEFEKSWDEWVSASSLRNYLLKDPVLDFFSYSRKFSKNKVQNISSKSSFVDFILKQGLIFESKVVEKLYHLYPESIVDIGGDNVGEARSEEKFKATIKAMNIGVPIIYSGVLHNLSNKTYGVPDFLIRSDWLKKIFSLSPIKPEDEKLRSPLLKNPFGEGPPNYHYRVVDIKFSTLYLRADGKYLLNKGSIPAYKGQLLIYNNALSNIQGYDPCESYILGRRWNYSCRGDYFSGYNCFDRAGIVDFSLVDGEYNELVENALEWIRSLRENASFWDLTKTPLPRSELYPNMCNMNDHPWSEHKKIFSSDIKEITNLWMCGPKNRKIAHSKGIYKWNDPRCNSLNLGVKGRNAEILDRILEINKNTDENIKFLPDRLELQIELSEKKKEYYVDFEFINSAVNEIENVPFSEERSIIFMIGVGHISNGNWNYKCFVVENLNVEEEKRICTEFSNYIRETSGDEKEPLLIHWSNAEKSQWSNVCEKYHHRAVVDAWIPVQDTPTHPRWFDLLKIFREEPIVIKGCFGFGLKEVATSLAKHNFIKSTWPETSIMSGTEAMIVAFNSSNEALKRGINFSQIPQIQEIVRYNEIDCKVLSEITEWIRKSLV